MSSVLSTAPSDGRAYVPSVLPSRTMEEGITVNDSKTTATYRVAGMTCAHCVGAMTSELAALPEVTAVEVELHAGGTSTVTVTGNSPLSDSDVAAALDEDGDYHLTTTS